MFYYQVKNIGRSNFMAMTGFNPDEVNSSINSVKSAYEALIRALGDDMQNQFVGGKLFNYIPFRMSK